MSLFITEAAAVAAKEAIKLAAVWFVLRAFLRGRGGGDLIAPFYWGVLGASLIALLALPIPPDLETKVFLSRLIGYVFFIFFMGSVAALYQSSGVGLVKGGAPGNRAMRPLVMALTVFYFLPDILGASMFLRELSAIKESAPATWLSAALGFLLTAALLYALLRRAAWDASRFFDLAQLLLFLSVVKLLGGGTRGFAELTLIPSVQRGVMKFVHDFIHQTFVFIMVPDHPLLKITTWNFIGVFFGPNLGMALTLLILLTPPLMFLYRSATAAPHVTGERPMTGAERRLTLAAERAERVRKAIPVAVFVLVILVSWFIGRGEKLSLLYIPVPKPVVEDKGVIVLPLTDPTMDLLDGRLHKFTIAREGEAVTFLVIKKPGGGLSVCLDACEICPPDGYGQSEGEVTCIYCMTPIPVGTLGKPGGCNPIPLEAAVSGKDIRIDVSEIDRKWRDVTTGLTKEGIR
jgi:hypothetical protein